MSGCMSVWRMAGVVAWGWAGLVCAQMTGPGVWKFSDAAAVSNWTAAAAAGLPKDSVCVWPGVVADRASGAVRIWAEASGLRAGIETEFLLIGAASDRAYEAFAVAACSPGDVVRALAFLGVLRGQAADSGAMRFWPRGERIAVSIEQIGASAGQPRPLSDWIEDREAVDGMPHGLVGGFAFTGGVWSSPAVCETDLAMPAAIIACFNEPQTVLDLPYRAGKGVTYGRFVAGEALPAHTPIVVTLRHLPAGGGRPRPMDVAVSVGVEKNQLVVDGVSTQTCADVAGLLRALRELTVGDREPFVAVTVDPAL